MAAHYCVDYLSHEWASEDLIRTYHETCKQYRRHHVHLITSSVSEMEQRKIQREQYKLQRFQNALWREMARRCTNKLSRPNHYINPSTVSW
jgi:ribosomal protein L44E